ncbi:MAG TPA: hypothetical protein VKB84_05225 [Candidatus Binataceae bacterium]|jgi:hypothetical protein|nr:hypothetical protein [Candidatus Binataceae bacterium]
MDETAKNPALLKLDLALRGVDAPAADGPIWLELQLDADIWARARINPDSSIKLVRGAQADLLREGDTEVAVRLMPEPEYAGRKSRSGVALGNIATVRGAYAVVELNGGCGACLPGRVCALCRGRELTEKPGEMWPVEDVVDALGAIFKEGAAEFVLFQVGYLPGDDAGLKMLFPYIETVRRHFDTIVALAMHPPADPRSIERAYAAGVDAISYNLEAADADSLQTYFPGRARFLGRSRYFHSLSHAAKVFPGGAVLCELTVGLSPEEKIAEAMAELTEIGVLPILSVDPARAQNRAAADLVPLYARLFNEVHKAGLNMSWARDLSHAITPLEARYFVINAPQFPVLLHNLSRNRIGALATRSLAKMRRRLRVRWVRASFDSSRL